MASLMPSGSEASTLIAKTFSDPNSEASFLAFCKSRSPITIFEKVSLEARVLTAMLPTAPHPPRTVILMLSHLLSRYLSLHLFIRNNKLYKDKTKAG